MKVVFAIILATLSYLLATDIYTPSMPAIGDYFSQDSNTVQKTLTYFLFGSVLSCIFAGYLADRVGRKKLMLYGIGIAVVGGVIAPFSTSIEMLLASRFLQGLGSAIGPSVGFAIVDDCLPKEKSLKIFGIMGMIFAVVPALAPFLGGFVNEYFGWQANFILILTVMFSSLIATWSLLPKDELNIQIPSLTNLLQSYKQVLSTRNFLILSMLLPMFFTVEWCVISFLPFYLQEQLGMSSISYGIFLGAMIIWYAVGSMVGSRICLWIGTDRSILIALWLGILGSVLLLLTAIFIPRTPLAIYVSLAIHFIGFGSLWSSSVPAILSLFKELKATAASMRALFIVISGFVGASAAELMNESHLLHLAIYPAATSLLALGIFSMRKVE